MAENLNFPVKSDRAVNSTEGNPLLLLLLLLLSLFTECLKMGPFSSASVRIRLRKFLFSVYISVFFLVIFQVVCVSLLIL